MVTDAGTPYSPPARLRARHRGGDELRRGRASAWWPAASASAPGHRCRVGVTTYACEMYVPSVSRFHWVVDRTVPFTSVPTTPQTQLAPWPR